MSFYKIIKDSMIAGVCTDDDFRRYQAKHGIIISSEPDKVEAVVYDGTLYHDAWMAAPGLPCESASVTEITEEEYSSLKSRLDEGGIPDDGSLEEEEPAAQNFAEEEPAEEVRKTAAQLLREQIDNVDSQVKLAARFASV